MKIYYDTEFLEDGRTIDLISIGMVTEDGREYYAVSNDGSTIRKAMYHPWLRENVLPSLPITINEDHNTWKWDLSHPDWQCIKYTGTIGAEVRDFIRTIPDPQLWAWYGAYDHVAYAQLYGPMVELPEGLPMFTCDLKQEAERLGNPTVPQQEAGQHNAIADARHNRVIDEFLAGYATKVGA
jgi:hypothetical protein